MSPYDQFACNIDVDHKQLTIFHVDNLTLVHVGSSIVKKWIKILKKTYGHKDLLVVTSEKEHEHLEMTFNF